MSRFIGESNFLWFFARIINVNDPDMLGQCQIRIAGFHDDIPDKDLPWAMPLLPIMSASHKLEIEEEVGISPTGLTVDSFILGFFADGSTSRVPVILGSMPTIPENNKNKHDVPKAAREINVWANKKLLTKEPKSPYKAKYPFNKVTRTLSGHTIELDDTPGFERIHIYHKSGAYIEMQPKGDIVLKSAANNYHIVAGNEEAYIKGKAKVLVEGNIRIESNQSIIVVSKATTTIASESNIDITAKGTINLKSGNGINLDSPNNNLTGRNTLDDTVFTGGVVGDNV
jgi:hypothetical protein